MKTYTKAILLFLLIICLCTNYGFAQTKKVLQIDSLIKGANQRDLFNGNVLIVENNKTIYKVAIGKADAFGITKLTEQYRFHIGSIAKEFNAVAIMVLKEQGLLKLDDKVSKYIQGLPSWANKIKIINLLQYTSGLPNPKWDSIRNDTDNFNDLKKSKLDFEPGTNYAYNNNNVFLQKRIVESISSMSFNDFVKEKLLKPLGMKTAIVDPTQNDKFIARSFNKDNKQDTLLNPMSGWTAVTLNDFYKWSQAINEFKLINPSSTAELMATFDNGQCGLGAGVMENNKMISHRHDGTAGNYQALLVSTIPNGRTVILMTNNKQNNLYAINTSIQSILDGKPYAQIKKSILSDFSHQIELMSGQQFLDFYEKMKDEKNDLYSFQDESTLNEVGYQLLKKKKNEDAILVFERNTVLYPESGNVFDSLGEAYYNIGNKEKALLNYKKSLALDPTNSTAKNVILELEK